MLLAIDVGNTNITMGVYDGDLLTAHFRLATMHERSRDEYGVLLLNFLSCKKIDSAEISAVIIASVVPQVMYSLERAVSGYLGRTPFVITNRYNFGLRLLYDNPSEIGVDRLVNAYAAHHLYGGDLVLVDFGTATTFCALTKDASYLGGVICPGVKISSEALFQRTSKLPRVEITDVDNVIGKTTVSAMQSGILFGYVGQVEYIVKKIKEEMGAPHAKVIGTGGLAGLLSAKTDVFHEINSRLTLEGLRLLYQNTIKE